MIKRFSVLSLLVPESEARYRKGNEVTSYYRKMFQTEKLQGFIANFENAKLSRTDESKQLDLAEASGFDPTTMDPHLLIFHSKKISPNTEITDFSVTASVVFQYRNTVDLDFEFKNLAQGEKGEEVAMVISNFFSAKESLMRNHDELTQRLESLALMFRSVLSNEVEMTVSLPKPIHKKFWFIVSMFLTGIAAIVIGLYFVFRKRRSIPS